MPCRTILLLAAAAVPLVARAQATWVVGPGGFTQIDAAIAVASPGDVIVVQPGTYQPFHLNKALVLRAQQPGTVTVLAGFGPTVSVPPQQLAHLVGLTCASLSVGGRVTIDDCVFTGGGLGSTFDAFVAEVHLQRCTLQAQAAGISAIAALRGQISEITAIDCAIAGADATPLTPSTPGIELLASRLRGSRLTVRGGIGGTTTPAVRADAGSAVWLADSLVTSNAAPCAIAAIAGAHARCTLTPNCSSIPAGNVLGVSRPLPPQNGTPFVLEFRDAPNTLVGVWAALDVANMVVPALAQSLLLPPAAAFPAAALLTDAQGLAVVGWPLPAGSLVVDRAIWFQGFAGSNWPLATSALAGGVVR